MEALRRHCLDPRAKPAPAAEELFGRLRRGPCQDQHVLFRRHLRSWAI